MADDSVESKQLVRCLRCKRQLVGTGREPYRFECPACGQQYFLVMQLVPVESDRKQLPEKALVE